MTLLVRVDLATCREVDGSGIESEVELILTVLQIMSGDLG